MKRKVDSVLGINDSDMWITSNVRIQIEYSETRRNLQFTSIPIQLHKDLNDCFYLQSFACYLILINGWFQAWV